MSWPYLLYENVYTIVIGSLYRVSNLTFTYQLVFN